MSLCLEVMAWKRTHSFLLICAWFVLSAAQKPRPKIIPPPKPADIPLVRTRHGFVGGTYAQARDGSYYFTYRGIPYAMPPVGKLRFAPPVPYTEKWVDTRMFTEYKPPCISLDAYSYVETKPNRTHKVVGDEDCLYLNIHVKTVKDPIKPVLFFLHGGFFAYGSPQDYEATLLMDHDALVYVNPAYRVGCMGFLFSGDTVATGNYGLKDQMLALIWVKRNIRGFAGDQNKITIAGLDAGAASVHFMYFARNSFGLFSKGMSFSGTMHNPWVVTTHRTQVLRTERLAGLVNCTIENTTIMIDCLRNTSAFTLVGMQMKMKEIFFLPVCMFTPHIDLEFADSYFIFTPLIMILKGYIRNKPWMTSATFSNSLQSLVEFVRDEEKLLKFRREWDSAPQQVLNYDNCNKITYRLGMKFMNRTMNSNYYRILLQWTTDRNYLVSLYETAQVMAYWNTASVFVYLYNYWGKTSTTFRLNGSPEVMGPSNGDDVAFFLKTPTFQTESRKPDRHMRVLMTKIVEEFVVNGTTVKELRWPPIRKGDRNLTDILHIRNHQSFYFKEANFRKKEVKQLDDMLSFGRCIL